VTQREMGTMLTASAIVEIYGKRFRRQTVLTGTITRREMPLFSLRSDGSIVAALYSSEKMKPPATFEEAIPLLWQQELDRRKTAWWFEDQAAAGELPPWVFY